MNDDPGRHPPDRPGRFLTAWIGAVGVVPMVAATVYTLASPAIRATFGLTYDRMGVLLAAGTFGGGVAALVGGVLLDHFAVAPLARAALLVAVGACIAAAIAPAWMVLGLAMAVLGAAISMLGLLPSVFFSDIYPADRTRALALWHMVVSLAAVVFPLIVGAALAVAGRHFGENAGWRVLLAASVPLFLGLLAVVPGRSLGRGGGVGGGRQRTSGGLPDSLRLRALAELARRPLFLSILIVGMLHVGADNSTYMWIVLMVKERFGAGPQALGVVTAAYSLAYAAGRLVRGTARWPLAPLPTIAVGSLIGSIILALGLRAPTLWSVIAVYATAGIFFSLNWPSTLGFASERFPDRLGTVLGVVSAVTGPATVAASALVGIVSRRHGEVVIGMYVPVGMFFCLGVFAAVTHLRVRRLRERDSA